ncbi:MAG: hypothetical protein ACI84E_000306, partial [Planctomycetota bacterium]
MSSSTPQSCESYRESLLVGLREPDALGALVDGHPETCMDCEAWTENAVLTTGFLSSMDRLVAPTELEGRFREELELGAGEYTGVLRSLELKAAPAALDQLIAAQLDQLAQDDLAPAWTRLIEQLPHAHAPGVLDRLVSEELSASEQAITKRFVGGLSRKECPKTLDGRLKGEISTTRKPRVSMGRSLGWGSAAAAALLVWIAMPNFSADAKAPQLRFQVVEVSNLNELSPFAQSMAANFMGLGSTSEKPDEPTTDGG